MFGVVVPKFAPGASVAFCDATPGRMPSSDTMSRPRVATMSIWVEVINAERSELMVCTGDPTATVVTASVTAPTFSWIVPTDSCSLGGTTVCVRSKGLKPLNSTRSV